MTHWLTELEELERLCAAAHDVAPHNRRLVGVEAPTLRRLIVVTRAVAELGRHTYGTQKHRIAEDEVHALASSLTPATRGGEVSDGE